MKNKKFGKKNRNLCSYKNGQMIVLMGVMLAISVFVLSSLAADIINLDVTISNEKATSIVSEFSYIKGAFGKSLNYDLTNISIVGGDIMFIGNITQDINKTFNDTRDRFYTIELRYGNILDAEINKYWYSYTSDENYVYNVDVNLSLSNGKASIAEDVLYSVVCQRP